MPVYSLGIQRYRITSAGRLIDSADNDLEPDGYITFNTVDRQDEESEAPGSIPELREYRTRFLAGQLPSIVRLHEESADRVRYGLSSLRWFEPRSFMFGDPDESPDADEVDIGLGKWDRLKVLAPCTEQSVLPGPGGPLNCID
jgi:hypothetical protein